MDILKEIGHILKEYSLSDDVFTLDRVPLLKKIGDTMASGEALSFILPAFPAKSPSRDKTINELPDYGEVLALKNLQIFCERMESLYPPGCEIIICSDGRVFSDIVNVSDPLIDRYNQGILDILEEYQLSSLRLLSMDDLYLNQSPNQLRELLLNAYAMDVEEVRSLVRSDLTYRALFNGIHRFLLEDQRTFHPNYSRSALEKITKSRTYELLRRSDAWSSLLSAHFPRALRLSIHPHEISHEKFGIRLIPSSNKWATPWHNVVVKINDRFELMHRKQALDLQATLKLERDKYAYFEVSAF